LGNTKLIWNFFIFQLEKTILAPFSLSLSLFHQWLLLGSTPFLLGFSLFIWLAIAKSLVVGLNCNRISNHVIWIFTLLLLNAILFYFYASILLWLDQPWFYGLLCVENHVLIPDLKWNCWWIWFLRIGFWFINSCNLLLLI